MEDNDYEYRTGDRCGIDGCRSRRYRTNESGFEECDRGHQHGLARGNADDDEDEFGLNLRGKRFRKEGEQEVKVFKRLKGKDAFELYLLCYQLVLRKQVWWMVHVKNLPSELEIVVHDLWALRVQNLRHRVKHETRPDSNPDSTGIDDDDPESLFSSQEFSDFEAQGQVASASRAAKTSAVPNLPQALATLYLATQMLRLPVLLGDFLKWIKSGSMLYFDVAGELPREMIERLATVYVNQFKPKMHLTSANLLVEVTRLALMYNRDFGMVMPPLNVPPVLFRLMEELALPLEVYHAVRRLAAYMKFDFTYPPVTMPHIRIIDFPEAQIVACIVIVLKIYYGPDGTNRVPESDTSSGAAIIDWSAWEQLMEESEPLQREQAIQMTDRDVVDLPNARIDDYLDFFQETFTVHDPQDRSKDVDFHKMMLKLFPIGGRSTKRRDVNDEFPMRKIENVRAMQEALRPNRIIDAMEELNLDEKLIRPGEQYKQTRNMYQETGHTEKLFKILSQVSGIPLKSTARAVSLAERLLQKIQRGEGSRGRSRRQNFKSRSRVGTEDLMSDVMSVTGEMHYGQDLGDRVTRSYADSEIQSGLSTSGGRRITRYRLRSQSAALSSERADSEDELNV